MKQSETQHVAIGKSLWMYELERLYGSDTNAGCIVDEDFGGKIGQSSIRVGYFFNPRLRHDRSPS
jgi:hypothetical protein